MEKIEIQKFASETMIDIAKLLITLASGFFVLSAVLIKTFTDGPEDPVQSFCLLVLTWVLLIGSIAGGILALGGIATSANDQGKFDVDASVTKWMLRLQQILFVLAFISLAIFAAQNK